MKKNDLIGAIKDQNPRLERAAIAAVLDSMSSVARDVLSRGEDFALPGVVRMAVVERAARQGRNPKTGEPIQIPAKRGVRAKPAGELVRSAQATP